MLPALNSSCRVHWGLPTLLMLGLVSGSASGASGPKLVLLPVGLDALSKAQEPWLTAGAEQAIAASGRFTLVPLAHAGDPQALAQASKAVEAEALMKSAHNALDDLDAQRAVRQFTDATALWRQADLTAPAAWAQFVGAWVMKAAALVANGETAAAKSEIEKILTVAPSAQFPDLFFPPDLLKLVEAQRKLLSRASGELLVRTEPAGAKVWIDGALQGASPAKASNLAGGKHLVVVSMAGFQTVRAEMNLGDELVRLKGADGWAKLKVAQDKVARSPEGPGRDATAREWSALVAGADQTLVLISRKSTAGQKLELIAVRLEARDGHNHGYLTGTVAIGDDKAVATFLAGVLGKDAVRDGKRPVTHYRSSGGSLRTATGIGLVGVGVAALGAGIFAGVTANSRASQFRSTPQVFSQYNGNLAAQGRTFALVADVSYLVSAVATVSGTLVLLTGEKPAAEEPKPSGATLDDDSRKAEESARKREEEKKAEARQADEARKEQQPKTADEVRQAEDAKRKAAEEKKKADEEDLRNF